MRRQVSIPNTEDGCSLSHLTLILTFFPLSSVVSFSLFSPSVPSLSLSLYPSVSYAFCVYPTVSLFLFLPLYPLRLPLPIPVSPQLKMKNLVIEKFSPPLSLPLCHSPGYLFYPSLLLCLLTPLFSAYLYLSSITTFLFSMFSTHCVFPSTSPFISHSTFPTLSFPSIFLF